MDDRGYNGQLTIGIIGAGFSGLSLGHYIREHTGLQSFVIYEKSEKTEGGAGTWKDNTYPGCACDVPMHLYQLSWAKRMDWTELLPLQPEIQNYLNSITRESGLHRHIKFGTELVAANWNDKEKKWKLKLRNVLSEDPENATYEVKHDVLIMATGPLSQPRMPNGIDTTIFKGQQFHSQWYRHDVSLENKRVAVVGNGCSATQFMPIIARRTRKLTQYISSPQWYVPRDNPLYTKRQIALFQYLPFYEKYYRLRLAYAWEQEAYKLKAGEGPAIVRAGAEQFLLGHLKATAPEKYQAQLTPNYPLGCKRLVFDSNYFSSLHSDNVELAFTRVAEVHENGLVGKDGIKKDFDVIIWATGFTATMPFQNIEIYGRSGDELHHLWNKQGAPSAYAGMQFPDFPNFYMMTGPNTLSGHFSVTTIIEIQAQYIAQLLQLQLQNKVSSFEVTKAAHNDYNRWIRDEMKGRVWTDAACTSWFKTKDGLIPTNFPGTTLLYWYKTYYPNLSHMKQIGGKCKVRGTSIAQELLKLGLRAGILIFLIAKRQTVMYLVNSIAGKLSAAITNLFNSV